jgi:hypothetical protein
VAVVLGCESGQHVVEPLPRIVGHEHHADEWRWSGRWRRGGRRRLGRGGRAPGALCLGGVHGERTLALRARPSGSIAADERVYGAPVQGHDVGPMCLGSDGNGVTL